MTARTVTIASNDPGAHEQAISSTPLRDAIKAACSPGSAPVGNASSWAAASAAASAAARVCARAASTLPTSA